MKYLTLLIFTILAIPVAGLLQNTAFSQPGNSGNSGNGGSQNSGQPAAFTLPRTDNERANERARPGGPRLEEGQQLVIIPGQGVVISPN